MQPKQLFGVIVRTIGLLSLIASVLASVRALATDSGQLFAEALVYAVSGASLMLGASAVVEWSYDSSDSGDGDAEASDQT
ncbi:MAG: hypothetical protein AAF196_18155 [Planctomycetota bacterium]